MLFIALFTFFLAPEFDYKPGDILLTTAVILSDSIIENSFNATKQVTPIPMNSDLMVVKVNENGYYVHIGRKFNSLQYPIYFVSKSELENNVIQRHQIWFCEQNGKMTGTSFSLTQMTLPFKFYMGKDPYFTGSLNLGTSFGYQVRINKYRPNYLSLISFIGLSSVRLDKEVTFPSKDTVIDVAALTGAIGFAVNLNKAQISAMVGWDYINHNTGKYEWKYNAKPWLTIGLGYTFFTSDQIKK